MLIRPNAARTIIPTATNENPANTVACVLFNPAITFSSVDVSAALTCAITRYPTISTTPIPIAPIAISINIFTSSPCLFCY